MPPDRPTIEILETFLTENCFTHNVVLQNGNTTYVVMETVTFADEGTIHSRGL